MGREERSVNKTKQKFEILGEAEKTKTKKNCVGEV